ncbi:MAG TPA: GNAT family N-acetyltransferase [Lachnospiraceae bacterium]|nr:GNAT family N-acetyltransferase [Lachnospiraceae bacterium]
MVRLAILDDVEQLDILNSEFNGKGETTLENIKDSILNNQQEVVIVADENTLLVGFMCIQLKKSFCYDECMPEITEVYVKQEYRKRGIASEMINFAEEYCSKNYSLHKYELLTGKDNIIAQSVYDKLGYKDEGEIHLTKRTKNSKNPI